MCVWFKYAKICVWFVHAKMCVSKSKRKALSTASLLPSRHASHDRVASGEAPRPPPSAGEGDVHSVAVGENVRRLVGSAEKRAVVPQVGGLARPVHCDVSIKALLVPNVDLCEFQLNSFTLGCLEIF